MGGNKKIDAADAAPQMENLADESQIILVPSVEVYQVEIGGHDRSLLYQGPLSVNYVQSGTEPVMGKSDALETGGKAVLLTAGPLSLVLSQDRNCIAAAPGVYLLSSDMGTHFYCLALGTAPEDAACVTRVHFLFKECCLFQKASGYKEAAEKLGVDPEEEDDPKILLMSSNKIASGIATATNGIVWTLGETSKVLSAGISKSADFLVDSGIIRSSPVESRINPGIQKALEATAEGCQKARDGLLWAIKTVVEAGVNRGLDAAEAVGKSKDGEQKPPSESARALSKISTQMLHTWFDVGDALEDAAGDVCISSAKALEKIVYAQNGEPAVAATRHALSATGNVVGTALGYRLYRRPEDGRLASTSKANAKKATTHPAEPEESQAGSESLELQDVARRNNIPDFANDSLPQLSQLAHGEPKRNAEG